MQFPTAASCLSLLALVLACAGCLPLSSARPGPTRELQQGGPQPPECHYGLFHGDDWSKDEIDCTVCGKQFNCEFDRAIFFDVVDEVECELERPGIFSDIDFSCPVVNSSAACDWATIDPQLPSCALEPVHRILDLWRPE